MRAMISFWAMLPPIPVDIFPVTPQSGTQFHMGSIIG